jgi:proteasome lid subunit RPN8/RPN11
VPERDAGKTLLPLEVVIEVFTHARECYPEECCGLLIGATASTPQRVVRCTNVQSQRHSRGESDLDARHGFWIDERELMRALREAEERGEDLRAVYHSHIDTEPYLSRADVEAALGPGGKPLWPGVSHLVVAVRDGVVREAVLYDWDATDARFVGRPVEGGD